MARKRTDAEFIEWFWQQTDQTGGPDACWPWTRYREAQSGTGRVNWFSYVTNASRAAYMIHHGAIDPATGRLRFRFPPDKPVVYRLCRDPACCNPKHLRLGSRRASAIRSSLAGLMARGTRNGSTKLTESAVRGIRASSEPAPVLARRFKVHPDTIRHVRRNTTWKHLN